MERIILQLFILFFISSVCAFGSISGSWRQVFQENPPSPRFRHHMAPIGDQQVLMTGGIGSPNGQNAETWLYDYPTNKWTKLNLEFTPSTDMLTSDEGNFMWQISKNRVICWGEVDTTLDGFPAIFWKFFLFDIDSMKWFRLDGIDYIMRSGTYLEENLFFVYSFGYFAPAKSVIVRVQPDEPFDSPNFFLWEIVNDEAITGQGPLSKYRQAVIFGDNIFKPNDNYQNITYIPSGWHQTSSGQPLIFPEFMNMERDVWKWFFLNKEDAVTLPIAHRRAASNLINNFTLVYSGALGEEYEYEYGFSNYDEKTYITEYIPATRTMKVHSLDITPNPGLLTRGFRLAKIKDGVVMLFGGERYNNYSRSNETWIFELTTNILDNYNEPVKIYTLGHNVYLLGDEIENAVLYNVLGQRIAEYEDSEIDLNSLPRGVYILKYFDGKKTKIEKLIRY